MNGGGSHAPHQGRVDGGMVRSTHQWGRILYHHPHGEMTWWIEGEKWWCDKTAEPPGAGTGMTMLRIGGHPEKPPGDMRPVPDESPRPPSKPEDWDWWSMDEATDEEEMRILMGCEVI